MCGIAGLIRWSGLDARDRACAARLPQLLAHRGPDGSGSYSDGTCLLYQSRLALIGPELKLPHQSACRRYTLVYNGEVFNYASFGGQGGDTEAVLRAWIAYGPAMLSRLNGMYSLFVWDAVAKTGFAAVDPLGVKPFLFSRTGDRFAFASEAGVLVESGLVQFAPDHEAIAEYLVAPYLSSASRLPFSGIERLPPGHLMTVDSNGRIDIQRHFCFRHATSTVRNVDDYLERLDVGIERAVTATKIANSTVGTFLSGGVDSSLIGALAGPDSPAWTIAYRGDEDADYRQQLIVRSPDVRSAVVAADHIGCPHHIVTVDDEQYEAALLRTLASNDLISAWEQEISQHLLAAAAASQGCKAVLVGDAADELHFGYSFLLQAKSMRHVLEYFGVPPLARSFLSDPIAHFENYYSRFARERGYDASTDLRLSMTCLIRELWLVRLLHNGDTQLMQHSVEGRVPFADTGMLDLAAELDTGLALRDGIEKWHLRTVAARHLPEEIAWRPKSALTKNLHAQPIIDRHFRTLWKSHGALIERYVDADAVDQLAPPVNDRDTGIRFRLLALLKWMERFSR